jgi:hypothetical protein
MTKMNWGTKPLGYSLHSVFFNDIQAKINIFQEIWFLESGRTAPP